MTSSKDTMIRHLISSDELFPLVKELLTIGKTIRIKVRGNSMSPFIRSDIDDITLEQTTFADIKVGDIVLIKRWSGAYVLHRVCKITSGAFYMVGDAQRPVEGPLYPDQLIAKGVSIVRNGRELHCDAFWLRLAAWIWLRLRPARPFIFRIRGKMRRLLG